MIDPATFCATLEANGVDFFTGVPDSLLKDFSGYVADNVSATNHVIAANEGNAVALAVGHYLATRHPAAIYLQNSGIGNAVNPLLSLADVLVYSIPLLLIIGWRGEPGRKADEPQHLKQGLVTLDLLKAMGVEYDLISADTEGPYAVIDASLKRMVVTSKPHALVISAGTFESYSYSKDTLDDRTLTREQAIESITSLVDENTIFVSTTGMASRELFEIRDANGQSHSTDFLTVGSMGHTSQIALAIALSNSDRNVVCIDGDGAVLMHAGGLAAIGASSPPNYIHIVINNGAHDSVGGQPIAGIDVDFSALAAAFGYGFCKSVDSTNQLRSVLSEAEESQQTAFIEVLVRPGARTDLGRPTTTPIENRDAFMSNLEKGR